MKLLIGLGNPDKKYEKTRHNIGWRIIDKLIKSEKYKNLEIKEEKKFFGKYCKTSKIILLKPTTYMNNSGQSVLAVKQYFKIQLENILVIHDDLDLDLGQIKIQKNKSAAGHNGVNSIINSIGSNGFWRLRIGINSEHKNNIPSDKFVISNFTTEENTLINKIIDSSVEIILEFINQNNSEFTNKNIKIPV